MPDTGWVSPGSHSTLNIQSSGGSWSNPSNAYDGDLYVEALVTGGGKNGDGWSQALILSGFGLAALIPPEATFDGLEVRWTYTVPFSASFQENFWLEIPGVTTTIASDGGEKTISNYYMSAPYNSQDITTREVFPEVIRTPWRYTIGSPTATWHAGLTTAGLRDAAFGVTLQVNCENYIEQALAELDIRVHYTGGNPMSVKDGGIWKTASPHVNDGGIWKPVTPFIKDGGIWKSQ